MVESAIIFVAGSSVVEGHAGFWRGCTPCCAPKGLVISCVVVFAGAVVVVTIVIGDFGADEIQDPF